MNTSYPTGSNSASQNFNPFIPKHLAEWVEGSAVSEAITSLNIESLTAKELNERIRPKEPIKTGGWWCRGVQWKTGQRAGNWYGQGKPDKPHQPEGSKPRKYLTGTGMEPDAIFLAMPDREYWAKVHADKSIPRHWSEGTKKAGAGLSIELATIALTGVWNWGKDGELARLVKQWAQPDTIHYIDFDSDYAANASCRAAILKFGRLLEQEGCEVYVTVWDTKFKGMDDFIKANGGDAFKEAVANAPTLDKWEKQLKKGDRKIDNSNPNISLTPHPRTRERVVCQKYDSSNSDYIPDTAPVAESNFVLKAEEALYSEGHWVAIAGQIYRFNGSCYELSPEVVEKRRIRDYLSNYSEKVKGGGYRKKYANSASINQVYDWVIAGFAVDPNTINPDGLNTLNGVIKVSIDGTYKVEPHDPKNIYTYVGYWYEGMGILDKEIDNKYKEKLIWHELSSKHDAPVKSINQLSSRLSEIFPKIQVCKYSGRDEMDRRNQRYLLGVGFVQNSVRTAKTSEPSEPVYTARVSSEPESAPKNIGSDVGANAETSKTITQSGIQSFGSDGSNVLPSILELCNTIEKLTLSDKQKLTELLTGIPCSDPLKAFRVGDKVAGNKPENSSYNWHGRIVEIHTSISCNPHSADI